MTFPALDRRSRTLLSLIREGAVLFDVGCDHAKIGIAALLEGRAMRVVASDIGQRPLENALRNASAFLSPSKREHITLLRCDGIPDEAVLCIKSGAPADILIAGMGGKLILQIIENALSDLRYSPYLRLILSPQSHQSEVREYLAGRGFGIIDEAIVPGKQRIYQIIAAEYSSECAEALSRIQILLGPRNIERGGEELRTLAAFLHVIYTASRDGKRSAGLDCSEDCQCLAALEEFL